MRRVRPGLWVLLGVVAAILALDRAWLFLTEAPERFDAAPAVKFRVEDGEGLRAVADRLADEGLVVSAPRFRLLARLLRADRSVQAGSYRFRVGTGPRVILGDLVNGRVRALRLTIPEGWRLHQIAAAAANVLGFEEESFLEAAADSARLARVGAVGSLEGYLFPDTYYFHDDATADEVVDSMISRFEGVWSTLEGIPPEGWSRHEVVTLASIVVAETSLSREKPHVAAVYLNRLRDGWRLQADPTVRYGLGRFTGRLYFKHLDVETPYNTYLNEGLPPGPVASPGREALQAVLDPLTPCEDYFFVAAGNGGHIFSRTKEEHDRAKRRVRSGVRSPAALASESKPEVEKDMVPVGEAGDESPVDGGAPEAAAEATGERTGSETSTKESSAGPPTAAGSTTAAGAPSPLR